MSVRIISGETKSERFALYVTNFSQETITTGSSTLDQSSKSRSIHIELFIYICREKIKLKIRKDEI